MSAIEELEAAVQRLSPEDRAAFRAWYAEFDASEWDRQVEADVAAGRLDWLIDEALADRQAGRCIDRCSATPRFWTCYRALAVEAGDDLLWVWIGTHAEYDRLLRHKV